MFLKKQENVAIVKKTSHDKLTPRCLHNRNGHLFSHKNLYTNASCSSIYNHQKLEITQMSFSGGKDKQIFAHPSNGMPFSNKKKCIIGYLQQ